MVTKLIHLVPGRVWNVCCFSGNRNGWAQKGMWLLLIQAWMCPFSEGLQMPKKHTHTPKPQTQNTHTSKNKNQTNKQTNQKLRKQKIYQIPFLCFRVLISHPGFKRLLSAFSVCELLFSLAYTVILLSPEWTWSSSTTDIYKLTIKCNSSERRNQNLLCLKNTMVALASIITSLWIMILIYGLSARVTKHLKHQAKRRLWCSHGGNSCNTQMESVLVLSWMRDVKHL